jgi:cell division protein FtsW (lipid II flippase)
MATSPTSVKIIKWAVAIFVITALFFSYQLPEGFYQQLIKIIFMALALLGMLLILNQKTETSKRWLNLGLTGLIAITLILYFLEN